MLSHSFSDGRFLCHAENPWDRHSKWLVDSRSLVYAIPDPPLLPTFVMNPTSLRLRVEKQPRRAKDANDFQKRR